MIMPKCSLVVHQGGAGTTAQAMRAGKPQLVVPFAHDQPDNAHRIVKAGLGAWRPRRRCKGMGYTRLLRDLMSDEVIKATARRVGELVAAENGVVGACDAIEAAWARHQAKHKK
jgi:UDP:flavonoid glycosyltransferase YjiC (YdhE family)